MVIYADARQILGFLCTRSAVNDPRMGKMYSSIVWYGYGAAFHDLTFITRTESVVILPPHGVQLESRHGLPSLPLFTLRRFIPLVTLQDVVINEGLRGWDVRHYLATIKQLDSKSSVVQVAYEVSLNLAIC
jgi:hypothetical protein